MNQWSLTILGMGTVFLALIALSLIVSLFPLIFRQKAPKPVKDKAPLPQLSTVASGASSSAGQGPELVAVIAAAVAAASGRDVSQFRITRIEDAGQAGGFTTPAWGHADRFGRSLNPRS